MHLPRPRILVERPYHAALAYADPRAVFILALCVVSGLPLLLGNVAPTSLEAVLPPLLVRAWGAVLTVGAMVTLTGMTFRHRFEGVLAEQVGSVAVGVASIFYSAAILKVAGPGGIVSAGIVLGWGLACCFRWWQLERLIRGARRLAD